MQPGQAGARNDSALPFRASLIFTLSEVAYLRQQMPLVPQPQLAESCRPTYDAMCQKLSSKFAWYHYSVQEHFVSPNAIATPRAASGRGRAPDFEIA